jgi:hypothetical protein
MEPPAQVPLGCAREALRVKLGRRQKCFDLRATPLSLGSAEPRPILLAANRPVLGSLNDLGTHVVVEFIKSAVAYTAECQQSAE